MEHDEQARKMVNSGDGPSGSAGVPPVPASNRGAIDSRRGWHSRHYLPHFDNGDSAQLVTFRLTGSFPIERLTEWRDELAQLSEKDATRERLRRIEVYLDKGTGNTWLRDARIARIVAGSLRHFDGDRYRLHTWVIMPNHVHVLLTLTDEYSLSSIVHSWKSFTAKKANALLERTGPFWQEDYFDRYIRNERHFAAAVEYVEDNPVRAGLCARSEDWEWSSASRAS